MAWSIQEMINQLLSIESGRYPDWICHETYSSYCSSWALLHCCKTKSSVCLFGFFLNDYYWYCTSIGQIKKKESDVSKRLRWSTETNHDSQTNKGDKQRRTYIDGIICFRTYSTNCRPFTVFQTDEKHTHRIHEWHDDLEILHWLSNCPSKAKSNSTNSENILPVLTVYL